MNNDAKTDYTNVVASNFFTYLKRKDISQKKYASDNNMDASILSKWKSGASSLTVDQVKQAAIYFGVTANDLVYSDKEKRKIEVLADKSYDPIVAQQSIKVRLFEDYFERPLAVIALCGVLFAFIFVIVILFIKVSAYYSLLYLLAIPGVFFALSTSAFRDKTFIINYLDDIFYQRKEITFKFYKVSLIIRIASLLSIFYYSTLFVYFDSTNSTSIAYFIALLFLIMFLLVSSLSAIISLPKRLKLEIYDHEIMPYNATKLQLIVHLAFFSIAILYCLYDFTKFYPLGIVTLFFVCLNAIDYVIISKEYAKYQLMYQENDKEPRALFSKNN